MDYGKRHGDDSMQGSPSPLDAMSTTPPLLLPTSGQLSHALGWRNLARAQDALVQTGQPCVDCAWLFKPEPGEVEEEPQSEALFSLLLTDALVAIVARKCFGSEASP